MFFHLLIDDEHEIGHPLNWFKPHSQLSIQYGTKVALLLWISLLFTTRLKSSLFLIILTRLLMKIVKEALKYIPEITEDNSVIEFL